MFRCRFVAGATRQPALLFYSRTVYSLSERIPHDVVGPFRRRPVRRGPPAVTRADDRDFLARAAAATGIRAPGPAVGEEFVHSLLSLHYGLHGSLRRIPTEKDETFHLGTGRDEFLIKISPPDEDRAAVNLQSEAMAFVARSAPQLRVQRLVTGVADQVETVIEIPGCPQRRVLRVMEYLPGDPLSSQSPTAGQLRSVGAALGTLDIALRDFRHGAEDRLLMWDLKLFHRMRALADYVGDEANRSLGADLFARFDREIVPRLAALETQAIHGDFSPFNVLVDPRASHYVVGVLDFGDTLRSPVIFEVSVGMANQLGADAEAPWAQAMDFLTGYRSVRPIEASELPCWRRPSPPDSCCVR